MFRLVVFGLCLGLCSCQTYNTISSDLRKLFVNNYGSEKSTWSSSTVYTSTGMPTYEVICVSFKPCSHVTFAFAFASIVKIGERVNKWWCSHLTFALPRTEWQRSKKNANSDVTCEWTFRNCFFSLKLLWFDSMQLYMSGSFPYNLYFLRTYQLKQISRRLFFSYFHIFLYIFTGSSCFLSWLEWNPEHGHKPN